MSEVRYAVGIDLGTTHCVMAAVDLTASDRDDVVEGIEVVPQLTAPGSVEERTMLPSFLYLPHPDELRAEDRVLPWGKPQPFVVGELARAMGGRTPIRLVSSAKSWLCHPGVDRRAAILPVEAPEEVARVSPLQASMRYLEHLRAAWDHQHPDAPLAEQEVVLTVPASFDPAARELTAEAAAAAGLSHLVLLEEPQAALYHWILAARGEWRKQVRVGDIILVIDLGGGTADFSLIAVTERDGSLELVRVAVGDHILLGGDNMDLALAHAVRAKLAAQGTQIDPWQLQALTHGCRTAKETLLGDAKVETVPVVAPSRGSKLIGGTLRTELTRAEVTENLVEGFFPVVEAAARPAVRARAALTKIGLPYAQDAAMTRHLAAFLGRQVGATRDLEGFEGRLPAGATFLHPTAMLFNGGVFKAPPLLARTLEVLNGWLEDEGAPPVRLLEGADLERPLLRQLHAARRWRAARLITATCGAGAGCGFAAAPPRLITSGWKARCRRCRGWSRRSRRCASPRSGWRRARRPNCHRRKSVWWSANRCGSGSSAPRYGARITSAPRWSSGRRTKSRNWRKSKRPCPPRIGSRAKWCRCACGRQ